MIRRTATSGFKNFYPPMGQTTPSEAAEDIINTSRESSGQWQAVEDNTNTSGGSSEQWQAAEDNRIHMMKLGKRVLVLCPACLALCQVMLELLSPMGQTAPTEVMIRRTATSGVQNFYPPMGRLLYLRHGKLLRKIPLLTKVAVDSGRLLRTISMLVEGAVNNGRMLRIISLLAEGPVDISIRLAAEDNTNASRGSSGQGGSYKYFRFLYVCLLAFRQQQQSWGRQERTAPTEAMIRTLTSGVQNFYPPMGKIAPSEVMIRRTSLLRVFPLVYIQPRAWQAAEDNTNASRGSSGQWQATEDNINASGGSSEQWQVTEDNISARGRNSGHW
ncbi:hypothetical protein T459_10015 [Capsicum annuum]|uniref:Uncharacterized protein n=1 Tax=Capsicum annuum TaxID=4072 RepID=A0A2G3A0Z2_CAPAN|nr:hypothetical protein T459_10015 [Capsicum annuum]